MLIKKEKKGNITIYYLDKDISDDKMEGLMNTYVKQSQIKLIIDADADVYDSNNNLLLKFRKNKLSKAYLDDFYENVINFAMRKTSNRGSTSGSIDKNVGDNPRIMTNIFGYFDRFSPKQKALQNDKGQKIFLEARECKFNMDYPEKYKKTLPLIKEIDSLYKKSTGDARCSSISKLSITSHLRSISCSNSARCNIAFPPFLFIFSIATGSRFTLKASLILYPYADCKACRYLI